MRERKRCLPFCLPVHWEEVIRSLPTLGDRCPRMNDVHQNKILVVLSSHLLSRNSFILDDVFCKHYLQPTLCFPITAVTPAWDISSLVGYWASFFFFFFQKLSLAKLCLSKMSLCQRTFMRSCITSFQHTPSCEHLWIKGQTLFFPAESMYIFTENIVIKRCFNFSGVSSKFPS